jgi:hypothetical protein
MKKLFACIIMMLCLGVNNSSSQNVVREGKVFKFKGNNKSTHKKDTLVTSFKWEAGGVQYPIIINKNSGSCYIWKKRKDGTVYPMYMKSEVSQQIARELNIAYKPRNKK